MEKKFGALRLIGNIFRILGYFLLVITLIGSCCVLVGGITSSSASDNAFMDIEGLDNSDSEFLGAISGVIGAIIALLYGGFLSLSMIGFAELIFLALGVEENTRLTALLMRRQLQEDVQSTETRSES